MPPTTGRSELQKCFSRVAVPGLPRSARRTHRNFAAPVSGVPSRSYGNGRVVGTPQIAGIQKHIMSSIAAIIRSRTPQVRSTDVREKPCPPLRRNLMLTRINPANRTLLNQSELPHHPALTAKPLSSTGLVPLVPISPAHSMIPIARASWSGLSQSIFSPPSRRSLALQRPSGISAPRHAGLKMLCKMASSSFEGHPREVL